MFTLKLDFLAFASIRKTLWKFPLCVTSHVDQQSSRIGQKMSHVFCIVRTQDIYVLSRGKAIWKSVAKNLDFFWLIISQGEIRRFRISEILRKSDGSSFRHISGGRKHVRAKWGRVSRFRSVSVGWNVQGRISRVSADNFLRKFGSFYLRLI